MTSSSTQGIADLYTRRHENRKVVFGDTNFANYGYWSRDGMLVEEACAALTELVADAAEVGPGDRVLDIGCGYGAGLVLYMRRQPASVVGIDVTQVRLQVAREVVERNGLSEKVQVSFGDATALEFEPETFTRVLAVECAFHFQTRRQFFAEAARVLAPGGRLALTDMIPRRGTDVQEFLARVYPVGTGPEFNVPENVYDADQYESFLRAASFDDVRIRDITNMTLPRFADHLEHLSSQAVGDKARLLAGVAEKYREHLRAGLEYVLVSARKTDARE